MVRKIIKKSIFIILFLSVLFFILYFNLEISVFPAYISTHFREKEVTSIKYYEFDKDSNKQWRITFSKELDRELYNEFFTRTEKFHFKKVRKFTKYRPWITNYIMIECEDKDIYFSDGEFKLYKNGELKKHYYYEQEVYKDSYDYIVDVFINKT